ncbi:MAG: zinc ABC transporter substrate-binding protein [Planctomycetota bacterium]|nr:zinc ABC transporter substrate-binding protein [Planctomycetota bacterium]
MTRRIIAFISPVLFCGNLLCLMALPGCDSTDSSTAKAPSHSGKLVVVATTGMVADMVRQIGGEQVHVEQLMRDGVDPHLYRPNTDDVKAIRAADVVFYNGFKLEGRMSDLLSLKPIGKKKHIALADAIPKESALGDPEHETADPHIWMDVTLWSAATQLIERELKERIPSQSEVFTERASQLRDRLGKLDALGKRWIETIPTHQRILITSHDAFRYFGRRYGLQVEGIQGVSTSSEAGLRRIRELVDMLVEKKIPSVFVESSVPPKSVHSIMEGAAEKKTTVSIGGELYSDAMGPIGSDAETYEGMMKHNFRIITKALGGEPTE